MRIEGKRKDFGDHEFKECERVRVRFEKKTAGGAGLQQMVPDRAPPSPRDGRPLPVLCSGYL